MNLQPNVEKAHAIILLDTNTIQQLDGLAERVSQNKSANHRRRSSYVLTLKPRAICKLCITNEEASSTCDIVYGFYKEQNLKPDPNEAKALFLGMAFDTRHFVLANSATFKAVADLVDSGVNAQEALRMLALPMDFSRTCRPSQSLPKSQNCPD